MTPDATAPVLADPPRPSRLDVSALQAIDMHTHAEVSCRQPPDSYGAEFEQAAQRHFGSHQRPTIAETIAYYRARRIALVMFAVDAEAGYGRRAVPSEEIAEAAREHGDILVPFASVDPHRGRMGVREARRLIRDFNVRGFKFHPTLQGFHPNDRMAYPLYEAIAEAGLPVVFHSGHSGIGSGLPGGGGLRLKYSNPIHVDDVAADFPELSIVLAHPSWPWQEEALSICLHKRNVYIDLSGWSPRYFSPQLVQFGNTLLRDRMLFGTDFPLITPDRWLADFEAAGFRPEVRPLILKDNAACLLGLTPAPALTPAPTPTPTFTPAQSAP